MIWAFLAGRNIRGFILKTIATLTMNPSIDISARVDQVIGAVKLRCTTPEYEAGGGGINVSKAIARLGGTSFTFYTCGGSSGELLGELLDKEAITSFASCFLGPH